MESECCPSCGAVDTERWQSPKGEDMCSECFDQFLGKELPVQPTSSKAAVVDDRELPVLTVTGPTKHDDGCFGESRLPQQGARRRGRPRRSHYIRGKNRVGLGRHPKHSECILCGALHFEELVERCRRCNGLTRLWTDRDLWLMERKRNQKTEEEKEAPQYG